MTIYITHTPSYNTYIQLLAIGDSYNLPELLRHFGFTGIGRKQTNRSTHRQREKVAIGHLVILILSAVSLPL
jgi:hypothetical protein